MKVMGWGWDLSLSIASDERQGESSVLLTHGWVLNESKTTEDTAGSFYLQTLLDSEARHR